MVEMGPGQSQEPEAFPGLPLGRWEPRNLGHPALFFQVNPQEASWEQGSWVMNSQQQLFPATQQCQPHSSTTLIHIDPEMRFSTG